jgi:hypothetical protein
LQVARFTGTNGKKNNGHAAKGANKRPFFSARKGAEYKNG